MSKESEVVFDFDKLTLNSVLGFRDDEMLTCALKSALIQDSQTAKLRQALPFVSGCDYLETNKFIEEAYKQTANFRDENLSMPDFFENIPKEQLKEAILNRRSIRAFGQKNIQEDEFEFIVKDIFAFAIKYNIDIFHTTHRVEDIEPGLYKNGEIVKNGDFRAKSEYLALEQKLGSQSGATFYFTSDEVEKYQKVNILSGFIAHMIYLKCELVGIGCSGIGAYYDDETKEFLNTKNNILYMLAIGR